MIGHSNFRLMAETVNRHIWHQPPPFSVPGPCIVLGNNDDPYLFLGVQSIWYFDKILHWNENKPLNTLFSLNCQGFLKQPQQYCGPNASRLRHSSVQTPHFLAIADKTFQ